MTRGVISLGEALRAAADLRPGDDETRSAILHLLGLDAEPTTPAPRVLGASKPSSSQNVMTAQRHPPPAAALPTMPAGPRDRLPPLETTRAVGSRLEKLRSAAPRPEPPAWLIAPGEVLAAKGEASLPVPPPPLFGRLWKRGILSAALATLTPEGDLDLERILDALTSRRPLTSLPRLPIGTLRNGVQVLLDRGPGMDPFRQDQEQLVQALDDVLSEDRLKVLSFAGCPARGVGAGPRDQWKAWSPPPPGVPVLMVTDFGLGGPPLDDDRAGITEWVRFIQGARVRARLVGLVPYEATRWPPAVRRAMTLVHWSERTSVGEVRRTVSEAWRRWR